MMALLFVANSIAWRTASSLVGGFCALIMMQYGMPDDSAVSFFLPALTADCTSPGFRFWAIWISFVVRAFAWDDGSGRIRKVIWLRWAGPLPSGLGPPLLSGVRPTG